MASEETFTREEMLDMPRLQVRRRCRARGLSAEDCAQMKFEDMVDWLIEDEGGGSNSKAKKATKRSSKKATKKTAAKETKKAPARTTRKKRAARSEPEEREKPTGEVVGDDLVNVLLEKFADMDERFHALEERVDSIGEFMDKNTSSIVEILNEVRADTYGIARRQQHLGNWMFAEGILPEESAPDEMDFEALEEAIEEECGGNEDGDE